jgi:hypothetical protein
MKIFGAASLLGLLMALSLIYWLRPLNNGAMALILLLCLSATNVIASVLRKIGCKEKP